MTRPEKMRPSLFRQNVMLLVGIVFAALLLAAASTLLFVVKPQVTRIANVAAHMIDAMTLALQDAPAERLNAVIAALAAGDGTISIEVSKTRPRTGPSFPRLTERYLMREIAARLATHDGLHWITDDSDRLWIGLTVAGTPLWLTIVAPPIADPLLGFVFAFALSFVLALTAGIIIQRRIARPLEALAETLGRHRPGTPLDPISPDGPPEIAHVAAALNAMSDRMEAHEAERSIMLAGVSHDLGTPLTRLRLALEMLRGRDDALVDSAERQVDELQRMLGQFLDFARGFEAEPIATVKLHEAIALAITDAAPGKAIANTVDKALTATLRPQAFRRAMTNLVANAARHGTAPITVTAAMRDKSLVVSVCDAGPGLSAERAAELTRPFARGDPARGGDGTGLGLAIAERVAAAHGGALSFEHRDGRFCVSLAVPR